MTFTLRRNTGRPLTFEQLDGNFEEVQAMTDNANALIVNANEKANEAALAAETSAFNASAAEAQAEAAADSAADAAASADAAVGAVDTLREDLANSSDPAKGAGQVGWSRAPLAGAIDNVHKALDTTPVSIWEFANLATGYVPGGDPATWDWGPAFNAALAQWGRVMIPPGLTLGVGTEIAPAVDKDMSIWGNGSTLVMTGNNKVISFVNSTDFSVAVSSVTATTYDLSVGGGTVTAVSKITAPDHNFSAGDFGHISSDDVLPDTDVAGQYIAEWFVVAAVVGDDIYTTGRLVENYVTNPYVRRPKRHKITIDGVITTAGAGNTTPQTAIAVAGFIRPKIVDCGGYDLNHECIAIRGCLSAEVVRPRTDRLRNDPAGGFFGYGVNDSSSQATIVQNPVGSYCRHMYSTTSASSAPGDNSWYFKGRTLFSRVLDGVAIGCANAYDTHAPAYGVEFIGCETHNDYRGDTTGGAAFQLRGNACRVKGGKVTGSKVAVSVVGSGSGWARTEKHTAKIEGLRYEGPDGHIPITITGQASNKAIVQISDSDITTEALYALDLTNCEVTVSDTHVSMKPASASSHMVSLRSGSSVFWDGGSLDLSESTSTGILVASHKALDSLANFSRMSIRGVANGFSRLSNLGGFDAQSVFMDMTLDTNFSGVPFNSVGASAIAYVSYRLRNNDRPLAYKQTAYAAAGNVTLDLTNSGEASILYRVECQTSGVVVNGITKGAYRGQRLAIVNRDTSVADLTITTSGAGLVQVGPASVTLVNGRALAMVWDGSIWRAAS